MAERDDDRDRETTAPEAKRDGRDSANPRSQPGEFADDMRVNRFTPPPDPPARDDDR